MTGLTSTRTPELSRLARWRLREPARLYGWPAVAWLLLIVLVVVDGWWDRAAVASCAVVVLVALEVIRNSVFSTAGYVAGVFTALRQASQES